MKTPSPHLKDRLVYPLFSLIFSLFILIGGASLNELAIAHNNGIMPVYVPDLNLSHLSQLTDSDVHLYFSQKEDVNEFSLVDRFNLFDFYFSIGDIILVIGLIFTSFYTWNITKIIWKGEKNE